MAEYETKFSGTKQQYGSGATRDTAVGKGKYVFVPPLSLKRLAAVYERGAANHGDRNWEQGFPMSRALDSAIRHIYQYIEGMRDEDHLAQAAWNLFAAMHFEEMIERGRLPKELNDLPNYMPAEIADYLSEPEGVEISAGRDLTAEQLREKLEKIAEHEPVQRLYGIVPSYGMMDGYGHDNRRTLFGSIVGTPTPKRDDWDEDYRGWDPKGTRDD